MSGRVPDFFVAGAAKCGTTSLAEYLRTHPGVYFSDPKEPSFYNEDTRAHALTREDYLRLFEHAPAGALLGEGSAGYLRSAVAIPAIMKDNPAAKLIVLLRDPVRRLRSLHNHYLARRMEDVADLQEAWGLQARRARGEAIPPYCLDPKALQYKRQLEYTSHVERMFSVASRDQVLIHISEEFFSDTRAAYLKTLHFLGLEDDGRTDFSAHNAAFTVRYRTSLAWLHRTARRGSGVYRTAKSFANAVGWRPASWFVSFNRRSRQTREALPHLDPAFEDQLRELVQPDIRKLESLLNRDLSVWRRKAGSANGRPG